MLKDILTGLFKPVTDIIMARQQRKAAREAAEAKLLSAKTENAQKLELNKDEWEQLSVKGLSQSWKDEYITVSVMSIFNLILAGGVMAAFGDPRLLEGIALAIQALGEQGVDVGFLLEAVALAGIGLSVWKRV